MLRKSTVIKTHLHERNLKSTAACGKRFSASDPYNKFTDDMPNCVKCLIQLDKLMKIAEEEGDIEIEQ